MSEFNKGITIKALQEELAKEAKGHHVKYDEDSCIISLNGKEIGQWNNEASYDYPEDLIWGRDISRFHREAFKAGHEAATERLLGLLTEAISVIEFYGDRNTWLRNVSDDYAPRITASDVSEIPGYAITGGKKAREFLSSLSETTDASCCYNQSKS